MWFVSKKKYDEMEQSRDRWMSHAEEDSNRAEAWRKVAISCQEDNKRLVAQEKEMLAKIRELEAKLDLATKERDYYYDLLESVSEVGGGSQ